MEAPLSPLPFFDWPDSVFPDSSPPQREDNNSSEISTSPASALAASGSFFLRGSNMRVVGSFQERAECRWEVQSHQVIGYNPEFLGLFEVPEHLLESGFEWGDFGLFARDHPATQRAIEIIRKEHETLLAGLESVTRFQFRHVTAELRVKHIDAFATRIDEEIRWICVERPEDYAALLVPPMAPTASEAPRGKRSATPYDSQLKCFMWKTTPTLAAYGLPEPPPGKKRRPKKE